MAEQTSDQAGPSVHRHWQWNQRQNITALEPGLL